VLLNFWYPERGPCREEFPYLRAVFEKYKSQGFMVITVNKWGVFIYRFSNEYQFAGDTCSGGFKLTNSFSLLRAGSDKTNKFVAMQTA
jgi:hypothetical protein